MTQAERKPHEYTFDVPVGAASKVEGDVAKELVRFNLLVKEVNQTMMVVVVILLVMVATMIIDAFRHKAAVQQNLTDEIRELNLRLESSSI